jgi:twitching motility protein PilT
MPFVDKIIQFMQSQQGERIVLESDQPGVIYRAGGASAPTKERFSGAQIQTWIQEILPEEHRSAYASGQPFLFKYPYAGAEMDVEVSALNGSLRASIGLPEQREAPAVHAESAPAEPAYSGPTKPVQHIDELFKLLFEMEGSDLHLSANEHPIFRVHGVMTKLYQYEINTAERVKEILWEITPERNKAEWENIHDTDFAYELPGIGRFRCNVFADRHGPGGVFRLIPSKIATVKDLNLTQAMLDLCFLSKGLVIVTGPTGSGKSTTLAALVDYINRHREEHLVTIEDPIEFVHENIKCLVNQREVHVHTESFARALRATLRQDPDIVLVGEMRDLETIAMAIETAETGHLVFATLHTTTAATTVDRIIDQFPADQQEQIRTMLSEALKAILAQNLCRTTDGRRVAAFEVLLIDPAAANLIREGKTYQLPSMMQIGKGRGCITMNDSLFAHVKAGRVAPDEAYLKSVDKVGLLQMLEKDGINYNPAHHTVDN